MNDVSRAGAQAGQAARRLSDHPWLEQLARLGFVASGLVHLMIGWVAARVALGGGGGGDADQGGALQEVRDAPFGEVLLWGAVVAFAALALFQLLEAVVGGGELKDRAGAAVKTGVYGVLAGTAVIVARGGSTDGDEGATDATQTLLQAPLGRALVAVVAVVIVGVAVFHVYRGAARTFMDQLALPGRGATARVVEISGVVGYVAKGVALLIVGLLFIAAAWTADPEEAGGLDAALRTLAEQSFGTVLLLAVALGLALYGVYSFARARYGRL